MPQAEDVSPPRGPRVRGGIQGDAFRANGPHGHPGATHRDKRGSFHENGMGEVELHAGGIIGRNNG